MEIQGGKLSIALIMVFLWFFHIYAKTPPENMETNTTLSFNRLLTTFTFTVFSVTTPLRAE